MVDFHQDVLSAWFCGEGVPDWVLPYERANVMNFARPLFKEFTRDETTHKIDLETCLENTFATYYATDIVGNMFECLYTEGCNAFLPYDEVTENTEDYPDIELQARFINYWSVVSNYFKDNEYVIGYDLINEPIAGDAWEHPLRYVNTQKTEKEILEPFYQNIMKAIYANDKNHIMFFEPLVTTFLPAGFSEKGPGADIGIAPEL